MTGSSRRALNAAAAVALLSVALAGCAELSNDPDGDGLPNDFEETLGTDPDNPDTDGDGLTDYDEAITYKTPSGGPDPLVVDTDDDGLDDHEEVILYGTAAHRSDTDGDGLDDPTEIRTYGSWSCPDGGDQVPRCTRDAGPDPNATDTDDDRWPDGQEIAYWEDRLGDAGQAGDQASTPDSDGDGYLDGFDGDPAVNVSVRVEIRSVNLTTSFESGGANLTVTILIADGERTFEVGRVDTGRTQLDVSWTYDVADGPAEPGTLTVSSAQTWVHDADGAADPVRLDGDRTFVQAPQWNAGDHTKDRLGPRTSTGDDGSVRYLVETCRPGC